MAVGRMQKQQDSTIRLLKLMLVLTLAVPAGLFAYVAIASYHTFFSLADERIERSLDAVGEHAAKVFQALNVTITAVERLLADRPDSDLRASEARWHQELRNIAVELPAVDALWVLDSEGRTLASSSRFPAAIELDVTDRDYFWVHLGKGPRTFVGEVLAPRIGRQPFFAVSRRRNHIDGSFAGVIVMSVLPADFHKFYQRLAVLKGSNYTVVREDGAVLVRYPGPVNPNVTLDANSGFMQSIAQNPGGGYYTTTSQVDGSQRRIAVRRLEGLPLYASTGLGVADIRQEWLRFLGSHLLFGIPAIVSIFALVWLAQRRTEELYAEAERRMAVEESLRQSQKLEAVGQLTGGVAHDFNNLLTIIIGNLEMALRKAGDGILTRPLSNALAGARRAAQLTQKLLAFSRRQPLDPRIIDVNRLLAGMADLLKGTLGERVEIETVGGAGLWRTEADPAELEAAILNLALNARDAMPDGGRMTIETSNAFLDEHYTRTIDGLATGQYVLIALSDIGHGMSPETAERAFEPFFTTKDSGHGTGLGLSQVYGFVKQSGGHVRIYSEAGQGTTVKMYLPRSDGKETRVSNAAGVESATGNGETVLVVEDDEGVRSYAAETLRELGYAVLTASDGSAALKFVRDRSQRVDLILTDVVLPGMNGREFAEAAVALRPDARVLFMTGYSRNAIVHHGRLDRGVALIQKPLSHDALAEKVREVLDSAGGVPPIRASQP
jgi:signal transduction histidine kinase